MSESKPNKRQKKELNPQQTKIDLEMSKKGSSPEVEYDMFGDDPLPIDFQPNSHKLTNPIDNFDDSEGYYKIVIGSQLGGGRFEITSILGKGVFSNVVEARDKQSNLLVAIKITRNNEIMRKSAQKELQILNKVSGKNIICCVFNFEHKSHLCLVFERMKLNLRQVLKKYGKNVGIHIKGVKSYATQLFMALDVIREQKVLHCDIKPDNILVTESMAMLKLADFGSAIYISEIEITPYMISRFYRAPEIILGAPFDYAIDVWSVGCTLYELYTGKMLFPGKTNNEMLKLMMTMFGNFPKALLRKATLVHRHFTPEFDFISEETDKINGKLATKIIKSIERVPLNQKIKANDDIILAQFVDFLEKCLNLNPERRLTPQEAFRHPFLSSKF